MMRVLFCLVPLSLVLCACSTTVEQVAQQSQAQWVCDADPATGEWDCRQVAIGEVLPLPVAVAVEQTPQQPFPALVQRTPVEQIVVEQQPLPLPQQQVPSQPAPKAVELPRETFSPTNTPNAAEAIPDKGYVVQLAALSNQAAVSRFIDEQQLSQESLAWHRTYSRGRHWYVVTTEPIETHVKALAAAGRLEGVYPGLVTWVRSLQSLQQVIQN